MYRGRIAPTPTGPLHKGHARTFYTAYQRCLEHKGTLVYREEDIDQQRCKTSFAKAAIEDLSWLGIEWLEGPDCGGPHAPYIQSQRMPLYLKAWNSLKQGGFIYPSTYSRKQIQENTDKLEGWDRRK